MRSQEGNAEIAAWEAIKQALPPEFQFKGRQIRRSVRSVLVRGVKALDPFNGALNYLYSLLSEQITDALSAAGFDKYFPGPGLIHRRHRSKTALSGMDRKENHELLYDFMDTYRAPFRFHLLLAFQQHREFQKTIDQELSPPLAKWHFENSLTRRDFKATIDEWHRRIYTLNEQSRPKIDQLFKLICAQPFLYKNEVKPLQEIISTEAKDFATFLLQNNEAHTPFRASDNRILEEKILEHFTKIKEIMESREPQAPSPIPAKLPSLFHGSIRQTIYGQTFGTLVFRDFFDSRKVKGFLETQNPQLPDFLTCLWSNHSLNFRVFNKDSVGLVGFLKHLGMGGHPPVGAIFSPRKKVYQASSTALYIYRPIDDLMDFISKSDLTKNHADLCLEPIINISTSEKISIPLWTRFDSSFEIPDTGQSREWREAEYEIQLPHEKPLQFPMGAITLLFADWKDCKDLFSFLHFLILTYQLNQQKLSASTIPKILYLDTTKMTLNFKHLIALSAPLSTLERILFTKLAKFPHLLAFITKSLSALIQEVGAEVVILNLPFDLIEAHCETTFDPDKIRSAKARLDAEVIYKLKEIALNTKANIILTSLGTIFDRDSERMIPKLPSALNAVIKHYLHLKHSRNHFQLEVLMKPDKAIEYLTIRRPLEKRKEEISLPNFSNF